MKTPKRIRQTSNKRGSTIVLMALAMTAMVAFMALGIDYAVMNYNGQRMQNAFDAAALASAYSLTGSSSCESTAREAARVAAYEYGFTIDKNTDVTFLNSYTRVRVAKTINYTAFFAAILGQNSVNLYRQSTAEKSGVSEVLGAIPLAINEANANLPGVSQELMVERNQEADFTTGELLALDLGMSSSKSVGEYTDALENGSDKTISVGQTPVSLNSESAETKKTYDALKARMDAGNTSVIVPVIGDAVDSNGNSYHGIIKFVTVDLVSLDYKNNKSVKETYVTMTVRTDQGVSSDTISGLVTYTAGGMYIIRLVDDLT